MSNKKRKYSDKNSDKENDLRKEIKRLSKKIDRHIKDRSRSYGKYKREKRTQTYFISIPRLKNYLVEQELLVM